MESVKENAIAHIKELPEDASYGDILHAIFIIQNSTNPSLEQEDQNVIDLIEREKLRLLSITDEDSEFILDQKIWNTVVQFLKEIMHEFEFETGNPLEIPLINPSVQNSIDLSWETNDSMLIV